MVGTSEPQVFFEKRTERGSGAQEQPPTGRPKTLRANARCRNRSHGTGGNSAGRPVAATDAGREVDDLGGTGEVVVTARQPVGQIVLVVGRRVVVHRLVVGGMGRHAAVAGKTRAGRDELADDD